jgi:REP element-mobilizing transposase RayT
MNDLTSYSSSIGRAMFHISFKVKYSHKIFENKEVQKRCEEIFIEVAVTHKITITEIGFDKNHVHLVADIGLLSIPQVAKLLKGTSGKLLLREFPWLKKEYFWNSGLWSPVIFFDSLGRNIEEVSDYVKSQ